MLLMQLKGNASKMNKSLLSRYRVDNVPLVLRPIFHLYGYGLGAFLLIVLLILRVTIRVEITGRNNLKRYSNHIFCQWHNVVPLSFLSTVPSIPAALDNGSYTFMQHPSWYMKPIHVLLRWMGTERIILGSTGHSGREAAEQIVTYLKKGYSTVLIPDGPHGPPFLLKKGILHMSLQSGVPIVAVQFSASKFFELKTWDRKRLPYPFSTIRMEIGDPIHVTKNNFDEAHSLITQELG
jgi:lysophospholipid acyltransferase (LPLAT)-like uncharacterized protein